MGLQVRVQGSGVIEVLGIGRLPLQSLSVLLKAR